MRPLPPSDFLAAAARRAPEHLALDAPDGRWSYADLDRRVDEIVRRIVSAGVPAGARVALLAENGADLIAALHAIPRAGCVVAPLNAGLTPPEMRAALLGLGARALIVDTASESRGREAADGMGLDVISLDGAGSAVDDWRVGEPRTAWVGGSDEWAVLWTSGTGGRARGVVLTAGNLIASAEAARERLTLGPEDRWYLGLSCAHVAGLALATRAAILGSTIVLRGSFDAANLSELIDDGQVTHASLVPTMLLRMLDTRSDRRPPDSLRCLLIGGAHTPRALVDRAVAAAFPIALTYGMTEASSQIATAPPEQVRIDASTVGAPVPGVEVRIDDSGEILVRGPTVASRYVGTSEPLTDKEGWLHTGDLGALDAEGRLRVTGRRGDRIVTGGVNVDPVEVEDVLRAYPGVADVCVLGVPDAEWGEVVAALVVPGSGESLDPAGIQSFVRERLRSSKVPRRIAFVEDVPRNANGKVDREAARAKLL